MNSHEYIDIIDENGVLQGISKSRPEVHSGNNWHNVVHIYVVRKNADNLEFLVHLRSKLKDHNPGKWDTRFGGHVKAGQTVEQTVVGELKEEIGLEVKYQDLIQGFVRSHNWPNNCERISVFYYIYHGDTNTLKFNDGEVQEIKWMKIDDLIVSLGDSNMWSGGVKGFQEVIEDLKNKI